MNKKVTELALGRLLFALSVPARAQQPPKVSRIGYLHIGSQSAKLTLGSIFNSFKKILILLGFEFYGS